MNENKGEHLELCDVSETGVHLGLDLSKVFLKLRTLVEESHWMDSPKLKIGGLAA